MPTSQGSLKTVGVKILKLHKTVLGRQDASCVHHYDAIMIFIKEAKCGQGFSSLRYKTKLLQQTSYTLTSSLKWTAL